MSCSDWLTVPCRCHAARNRDAGTPIAPYPRSAFGQDIFATVSSRANPFERIRSFVGVPAGRWYKPFDTHSYALMGLHDFPYGKDMDKNPFLLLIALAALAMTGCPSDNGNAPPVTSSSGTVVYLADQDTVGVFELFL